ncbi:hypothetical protein BD770DRAFT_383254 [Pilaira anomala]|nr:hypothetical protein BD770DRAFT_383254 [Pilaira anomala]
MSSRNKLPTEILLHVFKYIDATSSSKSLIHCQHVCKDWQYPSRVVFYKEIKFFNETQLVCFHRSMQLDSSLGQFVKSIDLSAFMINLRFDSLTKSIFVQLAKACPNLERLEARPTPHQAFWVVCYYLCQTYWTRLKLLPKTDNDRHYPEYLRTALACSHLERLELVPQYFEGRRGGRHWTEFAMHVCGSLKNVNRLRFIIYSYREPMERLDALINQFQGLKKLNLKYEGVHRFGEDHATAAGAGAEALDFKCVLPMESMYRLKVKKGHLNSTTIQYLLHKFPKLEKIKLELGYCHSEYTDEELNILFDYAMGMQEVVIELTSYRDLDILGLFVQRSAPASSGISLSIRYQGSRHTSFGTYQSRIKLLKKKQDDSRTKKRADNIAIPQESMQIMIETDRDPLTDVEIYQKNIHQVIGNQLSFLDIDIHQGEEQHGRYDIMESSNSGSSESHCLDDIFLFCPSLKTLVYRGRYLDHQSVASNPSICQLTFIRTKLSRQVFGQVSRNLKRLGWFQLIDCEMVDEEDMMIDMAHTQFQLFHLSDASKEIRCINLTLSTHNVEYYFQCKRYKHYSITSVKQMNIHLKCKSIQSIHIAIGGLKIKHVFK